jgi:Spy/CpxP family protein refolding chaperone
MNKTKLSIGVFLVFLVGVLAGSLGMGIYVKYQLEKFGPGGPPPPPRHGVIMKRLSRELDLTQTQRTELKKILEESEAKISAIRDQFMPKIEEIADQSFAAMKEKLNADQQKKLERIKEKIDNRFAKAIINSFSEDNKPEQILSKLKKHLNLTKEQIAAVQPIIKREHERLETIVEKYREPHRPKIRFLLREIRELRESTDKQLENLLTETQMEKYREIQQENRFEMHRKTAKPGLGPID